MSIIKQIAIGAGALVAVIIGLNSYTVVEEGFTKVEMRFGKVIGYKGAGFHIVNPLSSFDEYETRNNKDEFLDMLLPTKDRFNSTANVTVTYNIEESMTPKIKGDYGNMRTFVDRALSVHLVNIIKDESRRVDDSRGLADGNTISTMQQNTKTRLQNALSGTGIILSEVLIQDVKFDPRIAQQILATQQRIQAEEAEKSQERIEMTKANQRIERERGETESKKLNSDAAAYQIERQAAADAKRIKDMADAERYQMEQIAAGNKKLQESLTPQIIKLKELEVQMQEAGRGWNGTFADNMTIVVGGEGGSPNMPILLKNIK